MRPEYPLDTIADTLPQQVDWDMAISLGRLIVQRMENDGVESHDRYYWLPDVHDTICGISEQPDLTGEVEISMHRGDGVWMLRPRGREMPLLRYTGQYVGFSVGDVATTSTLMQVVLPTNKKTARLLQHGATTSYSHNAPQRGIMTPYDTGDMALHPRRVNVAAQLLRTIIAEGLPARPNCFKTDEEEEAFLDKYFPYRDVPLTGGGGKTVRIRAAAKPQ